MRILSNVDISGSVGMASTGIDNFTIGTELENNNALVDNLTVNANANFRNNVTIGSSSIDVLTINATITASQDLLLDDASLVITGSGTIYYNGVDILSSTGGEEEQNYITDIVSAGEIITQRSSSTVTLNFNTASLDGYKFLLNSSSYSPEAQEKTIYFSFDPHYNNITYFNANNQYENLKSAEYAVSDISMSINLPPVNTHLGKTFTFINASYVGTASSDTIGYSASLGGLFTTSGKYSVHKITFYPYSSGNYTDYISTGKLTGISSFSTYLVSNAVRDYRSLVGHEYETDQHNFITLQAVSSSQFGYTWMIRDVNDYRPFTMTAV
jgi:hypothetical protein